MSLTRERHTTSILQNGQAEWYLIDDVQRLRSETRDGMTMRTENWDRYSLGRVMLGMEGPLRTSSSALSIPENAKN